MKMTVVLHRESDRLIRRAAEVCAEELARRGAAAAVADALPADGAWLALGRMEDIRVLCPAALETLESLEAPGAEGFRIAVLDAEAPRIVIAGADSRGCLYGVGHVLRKLIIKGDIRATSELRPVSVTPRYSLRGHQLAYRDKQNSCPAWTVADFDRYIRELALFGANAIELLPPRTDDALFSPLFSMDPYDMMVSLSEVVHGYGLDVWLWYPNMGEDYDNPAVMAAEIAERERVFAMLPHLEGILIPAGDPGELQPRRFFEVTGRMMAVARRYHPAVKVYVAPQVFAPQPGWNEAFYEELSREPEWLTGVCYSSWVKGTIADMQFRVPEKYRHNIRHYADITHPAASGLEVPEWDTPFALQGRECYCPRSVAMKHIQNHFGPYTMGSLNYSEGSHDDVNKFVWSDQDFDPTRDPHETVRDYVRLLIDPDMVEELTQLIFDLEDNWKGPAVENAGIDSVYARFRALWDSAPEATRNNYRFKMAYQRALMDVYLKRRAIRDASLEAEAVAVLRQAGDIGAAEAVRSAWAVLDRTFTEPVEEDILFEIQRLAEELRRTPGCRIQQSARYLGGQHWIRGAWLDALREPINDAQWYTEHFRRILAMTDEGQRLEAIARLLNWENPGEGGMYVCLGRMEDFRRHVVPAMSWEEDPGRIRTPQMTHDPYGMLITMRNQRGWVGERPIRLNWIRRARVLYGTPLVVRFDGLDPQARYCLQVTYPDFLLGNAPERADVNLYAGTRLIHSSVTKPSGDGDPVYRYALPAQSYQDGTLTLTWQVYGWLLSLAVSEIWIIREEGAR